MAATYSVVIPAALVEEKQRFLALVEEYPETSASDVGEQVRLAALKGANFASQFLNFPMPRIRWFRKGLTGSWSKLGYTMPLAVGKAGTIYVKADITPEQAIEVAAHEVAHLAGADEEQARNFGKWCAAKAS